MLNLSFTGSNTKGLRLLLLGAHCDDIEIGCGGTILKWMEQQKIDRVQWVVFTSDKERKKEAVHSAETFTESVDQTKIQIHDFKDGFLPSAWSKVKDEFESLKQHGTPDVIFTHYRNDLHQDHRLINELTWNTFRNHLIFEYEIPKYDGDLGNPNVFVPMSDQYVDKKKKIISTSFRSQTDKQWFDDTLFSSVMRIRGMECASPSDYAEAFYSRKMTF